jgi:hypothetical protein
MASVTDQHQGKSNQELSSTKRSRKSPHMPVAQLLHISDGVQHAAGPQQVRIPAQAEASIQLLVAMQT